MLIGKLFCKRLFNINSNNISIYYIIGLFLISNLLLFLNFFSSLNKNLNTIVFLLPFFYCFYLEKKTLISFLKISAIFSLFSLLLISYDTVNRPDGGLYHLPFTSILNENKIILGVSNLHFRFGHTSIIQYLDAGYNNIFFNEYGLIFPRCIFLFAVILYFVLEFKEKLNNNKNNFLILITLIIFQISYDMNRYSYLGNDVPGNLILILIGYFFLKCYLTKYSHFLYIVCLCIFSFQLKSTLIPIFLLPLLYVIYSKRLITFLFKIKNFLPICIMFFWVLKNLLISGCIIFPVYETCFSNIYWNSSLTPSVHDAIKVSNENEAWAKGWPDRENKSLDYNKYLNSNWIKTWANNHGKNVVLKKILPLVILVCFMILYFKRRNDTERIDEYKKKHQLQANKLWIILIVYLTGSLIWFFKFPTYRYGSSFIIFSIISFVLVYLNRNFKIYDKEKKVIKSFILFIFISLIIKYIGKYDDNKEFLPNIYSFERNVSKNLSSKVVKKDDKFFYYSGQGNLCMYSPSPCTNLTVHEKINLINKFNYKIYYLDLK